MIKLNVPKVEKNLKVQLAFKHWNGEAITTFDQEHSTVFIYQYGPDGYYCVSMLKNGSSQCYHYDSLEHMQEYVSIREVLCNLDIKVTI